MKTPHSYRQKSIHAVLLFLVVFIAFLASHCTTTHKAGKAKDPCRYRRGMSGYGYGWLRNKQTGLVCILSPTGKIVEMYYEYPWDKCLFS